ncbi:hypothetical protein GCM10010435_31660 [Winogradskya consettensis]|uniref:Polyhydroxybutyrate depolymerase n=1 Tax=Winogradskya consettensis TaxID=113560 RepID=A0A919VNN4_9ACTN|nr:PHB depolymerase family esterase [Actinoplanes consettensis]GIM70361.1 hypothetical protein Aco04nite_19840 [Actinoplanes consettensis]
MLRRLLGSACTLLLLLSLFVVPAGLIRTTYTITVAGLTRSYLVVRPATSDRPLPVLVELHGCCTTPDVELARSGFLDVTGPAILVYPAGYQQHWNAGACCGTTRADDVAFITAVVSRILSSSPAADPARLYLAGYSNGGRMAYRIACEKPSLFTAVAVFGAVNAMACPDPAPVSLLVAAGTADPDVTVLDDGPRHTTNGYLEPTVSEQAAQYVRADGCSPSPTTIWNECASGKRVQLTLYEGAGHGWRTDIARLFWDFFTR